MAFASVLGCFVGDVMPLTAEGFNSSFVLVIRRNITNIYITCYLDNITVEEVPKTFTDVAQVTG